MLFYKEAKHNVRQRVNLLLLLHSPPVMLPLQEIWSVWDSCPPVHRKLSVTISLASTNLASLAGADSLTFSIQLGLCGREGYREIRQQNDEKLHGRTHSQHHHLSPKPADLCLPSTHTLNEQFPFMDNGLSSAMSFNSMLAPEPHTSTGNHTQTKIWINYSHG